MDDQIGRNVGRELPKITGHPGDEKTLIGYPLACQLRAEFLRVAYREDDPAPSSVTGKTQEKIPSDETRGTGQ